MSISCVIITLNEAEHIKACITSVLPIVDEVIVVDAHSTDKTVDISREAGAKVLLKDWEGYGNSRNYGADQASHDWILSIDADERLTEKLAGEIQKIKLNNATIYTFNRITNYCGQWIKHGTWFPEWKSRLYNRKITRWDDKVVHERLNSYDNSKIEKVKGLLEHYAYNNHQELEDRLSKYAKLYVQDKLEKGTRTSLIKKVFGPHFQFLKSYVLKLGFLDGAAGYKIAKAIRVYSKNKYR